MKGKAGSNNKHIIFHYSSHSGAPDGTGGCVASLSPSEKMVSKKQKTKTMKAVEKDIPFIFIEPKVVERSNLMDVVNDDYEEYDEIFKNVPESERPKR